MTVTFAAELEAAAAAVRDRALPAVVGVGSRGPSGSGIVFGEGLVVTSAHNVHSERPGVHFGDGSRREASQVAVDMAGDLAVIKVATGAAEAVGWAAVGDSHLRRSQSRGTGPTAQFWGGFRAEP
jgi:S1-C subfamily serine protease